MDITKCEIYSISVKYNTLEDSVAHVFIGMREQQNASSSLLLVVHKICIDWFPPVYGRKHILNNCYDFPEYDLCHSCS